MNIQRYIFEDYQKNIVSIYNILDDYDIEKSHCRVEK